MTRQAARRCVRWWLTAFAVVFCLLGAAGPIHAACTVSVTAGISFGTYDVFAPAPLDTTGYISYKCTGHASVQISLTRGQSTTYAARTLRYGADLLQYNLFIDPARTLVWGDGTEGTGMFTDSGSGLKRDNLPIYARMRAGQDARPGAYIDSVTVVIDF
jgi:spore coat protein U-like protein